MELDPQKKNHHNNKQTTKNKGNKKRAQNEDVEEKKATLRTSVDVYNRIKWDHTSDKTEWRMGYHDRFKGMLEIPLLEFIPGGDIPWHRHDLLLPFSLTDAFFSTSQTKNNVFFLILQSLLLH